MLDSGEGAHDTEFHTLFHLHELFFFFPGLQEEVFSDKNFFAG